MWRASTFLDSEIVRVPVGPALRAKLYTAQMDIPSGMWMMDCPSPMDCQKVVETKVHRI